MLRQAILQGPLPTFPQVLQAVHRHPSKELIKPAQTTFQQNSQCMLWVIIQRIIMDADNALIENMGDLLRVLIDPERFERQERDTFLGIFYDHYIFWLLSPFAEEFEPDKRLPSGENWNPTKVRKQGQSAVSTSRRVLVDLLSMCVNCHSYRMKYFVMRNNAIPLVLRLMRSTRHRHLHLSAIKFVRTIVAAKDEFYYRHLIKQDLLRSILEVLKSGRDTLLSSAVLELVDFIRNEKSKLLASYIVEKHLECFTSFSDVQERLKADYDMGRSGDGDTGINGGVAGGVKSSFLSASASSSLLVQKQRQQQERDSEDAYFFDDDIYSFGTTNSSSAVATSSAATRAGSALSALTSAYADENNGGGPGEMAAVQPHQGNAGESAGDPPLPPLRPKFEVDELPDTLVRVRSREVDLSSLDEAKPETSGGSVSFTFNKKRVCHLISSLGCIPVSDLPSLSAHRNSEGPVRKKASFVAYDETTNKVKHVRHIILILLFTLRPPPPRASVGWGQHACRPARRAPAPPRPGPTQC
jgi:hypothetical protein